MDASSLLQEGWRLHQQGQWAAAVQNYQRVLETAPEHADAWCYMGIVLYDLRRFDDSVQAYRRALRARPAFPVAWSNMGNSLAALQRYDEAIEACRRAISLKPNYATAHLNLGAAMVKAGHPQEAELELRKALELAPRSDAALRNLSAALVQQGDVRQGQTAAQQAVSLNPHNAEAHRNLALVRMLRGEWPAAFEQFEWRWRTPEMRLPETTGPYWNGEPLHGRRILLHAEQGLGDTIQFARYAVLVKQLGAEVILQCQPPLKRLLSTCAGIDELIDRDQPIPAVDFHCPLMSLPRLFGHSVTSCPSHAPYLSAEPERRQRWRSRLGGEGFKIGVAWRGSASHQADAQRTAPLAAWRPLAQEPGVRLISLQKGSGLEQLREVDFPVLDLGPDLDADAAFLDTAAVIRELDLVVTIDTSIAHLAGALAAPTWVALSVAPDWRWLLDRDDSVWYPSLRLFRQRQAGEWSAVFQAMAEALGPRLRESST